MHDARHDVDLTDGPWPAAVIRDLPVGLLEMDAGGRVVRANRALVRLLAPVAVAEVSPSGRRAEVEGRLVTECWPRLAGSAVTVLSGRAVDTMIRCAHADLRVSGVPRWLGARSNGGLLVVGVMAPDRTVVVDLRDGAGMGSPVHARADLGADTPSAGTGEPVRPPGPGRRWAAGRWRRPPVGPDGEHAATHDAVTGLPNQVLLLQGLTEALATCRHGRRVAVLAVRVGVSGRRADDEDFCRELAERLSHLAGPLDVAARLDGARFAVVLRDLRPGADIERFAVRAQRRLHGHADVPDPALGPTPRGCGVEGLGMVVANPRAGSTVDRDPRLVLALALEAMERSDPSGCRVVETEPPAEAERARVEALASYDLYDGALDDALQGITQVAVAACRTAAALVTFVDSDLQWVRAVSGEDLIAFVDARAPRHLTLCDRTIRGLDVLVVPDTRRDPEFQVSRHVGWQVGMRFYAGAPLVTEQGRAIGTLCVLDSRPRELSERQRYSLAVLAAETVALLEPHRFR